MHFAVRLGCLLAQSVLAASVIITLFNEGGCDPDDGSYMCSNFPEGTDKCCGDGANSFGSVRFNGLPTQKVPAQGVAYEADDDAGTDCGVSCDSGAGNNLCLTCDDDLEGANWFTPHTKRDTITNCTRVLPDALKFRGGRVFAINYDTPAEITARLEQIWREDMGLVHTELPPELLRFEYAGDGDYAYARDLGGMASAKVEA